MACDDAPADIKDQVFFGWWNRPQPNWFKTGSKLVETGFIIGSAIPLNGGIGSTY